MGLKEDIKAYIAKQGYTMTKIVEELNKRHEKQQTVQNLSKKINNETLKYDEVLEIADILGYEITWTQK